MIAGAVLLALALGASQAQSDADEVPGQTFAAYEYGWYPIAFVDHFRDPLSDSWELSREGRVLTQNGMLTIVSETDESVGATLRGEARIAAGGRSGCAPRPGDGK